MARTLFLSLLLAAPSAWAAGFFRPGVGVGNLGAGGTGIVSGSPGYGHWYNPSLLGFTQGKVELTLDWTGLKEDLVFKRSREGLLPEHRLQADEDAGGYYSQRLGDFCCANEPPEGMTDPSGYRHIPFLGIAWPLRRDLVMGLAVYGPQGPRRDLPKNGSQRYAVVSNDITLAITQLSLAYRQKSWGVGLGLANFTLSVSQVFTLSGDLEGTENPDFDAFAGVKVEDALIPIANVGFWAAPLPGLKIGASYQRPLHEKCTGSGASRLCGHVHATGTVDPELAPGLDALADVTRNEGGALMMRFPAMARLGAAQQVTKNLEVSVEGYWEAWGTIGDLTFIPNNVVFEALGQEIELDNVVFPRPWVNTYGARFGSRWDMPKAWTHLPVQLRTGALWESSAAKLEDVDPGGLDWEKLGLTVGFGVELIKGLHLDAFYLQTLTAEFTVSNSNTRTVNIHDSGVAVGDDKPLETVSANGTYRIDQHRFGLGFRYAL